MCEVNDCNKKTIAKGKCQFHYDRFRRYGDLTTRPLELDCQDCSQSFAVRRTGALPIRCELCQIQYHRTQMRLDRHRKGLWELYKLTPEQYQEMYDLQNGLCYICQKPTEGRGKNKNRLAVDHNHSTGKIRGLLCSHCNTALGLFRDSQELLQSAINYLNERD
jgi:hypothetical protein